MWRDREEVEGRLVGLVRDFLDARAEDSGDDDEIDLGHIAIVAEMKWRRTPDEIHDIVQQRERPEVGYTPEADGLTTSGIARLTVEAGSMPDCSAAQ